MSWKLRLALAFTIAWMLVVDLPGPKSAKPVIHLVVFALPLILLVWVAIVEWGRLKRTGASKLASAPAQGLVSISATREPFPVVGAASERPAQGDSKASTGSDTAADTPASVDGTQRKSRMPIIVLNVMLIVLGVIAANVQMWRVPLDANASASYWAGAWLVLCLIAYGVVRAIARWAYGYSALAAAVLFVVGINAQAWQTSSTYWMESSVKKSAPLMNALMTGQAVSDAEIRAAKVGIMEPVLLAEAGQSRAMVTASRAFEAEMAALNLDEAFNSESLGTEAGRRTARGKIKASREALREYLATGRDLIARGEGQMREAMHKAGLRSDTYINAYLANTTKLRKYFDDLERVAGQMTAEQNALLTLLDQNTRHFVLQHDNEAHLVFDDDQVLTAFRARATRIDELGAQAVALDEGLRSGVKQTQTQYNKYVETIK